MSGGPALGPFALDHPLAEGAMGRVWAGHHRAQGLPIAIKVLTAARARSPAARAALWAEARAVARIDHPAVVRLLDAGEVGPDVPGLPEGSPFLVMERADGSLADRLPLPPAEALAALRDVLAGLAAAHARGVVHRDVKPANVLRLGRRWVLADFGVAAAIGGPGSAAGTPTYMAPEQLDGGAPGPWTDLYAVGCLAHALLTGRPPFPGPARAAIAEGHRFGRPPPLSALELPPGFAAWVDRLLAKDPARRFRCAADALAALDGAPPGRFGADWRDPAAEALPPFDVIGAGLGLHRHRVVPLAGREAERDALWAALGEVHATGDLRIALVLGAEGVGKSRLARWFVERAAERGLARVVRTVGDAPVGDAAAAAMHLPPGDGPEARRALAAALAEAGPSPDELSAIARLVTGATGGEQPERARAAAMACWLGLWAAERPVIWWIDDADRAPEAIDAVERCLAFDDGAGLPLLVVLTAPDGAPDDGGTLTSTGAALAPTRRALLALAGHPATLTLPLDPLPPLAARRLVRDLLHLDGALADALVRRTAGHPGFAVQWVADRVEHGALVAGPDGFVPAPGAAVDVPLDPAGQWARQAAALARDPVERRLLEAAAALGPAVDRAAWRRMADPAVADRLEARLLRRDLIRPAGPRRWRFVHAPLAEALAAAALRAGRWAAINRDAAAALAEPADPDLLARLHLVAGAPEAAIGPLLDAARQALERGANAAALARLDTRDALLSAHRPGPDPEAAAADRLRLRALRKLGRPDEAIAVAERLWRDPPADAAARVEIVGEWTAALRRRGRFDEAIARMGGALADARAAGDPALVCDAAARLARQLAIACRFDEARQRVDEALAAAPGPLYEADARFASGLLAVQTRDWPTARRDLERARALRIAAGHLHGAADCDCQLGEVARATGDLDRAFALNGRAIDLTRLAGAPISGPLLNHGFLALDRGDALEARRLLRQASGGLIREGDTMALPVARLGRLWAAALLADAEEWAAAGAIEADLATPIWPEIPDMLAEVAGIAEAAGFDAAALRAARARLIRGAPG